MTEISAFLGVRPRAGPPRNSLQTRVESSGLPKTRCRLRIDLEPASIWGMSHDHEAPFARLLLDALALPIFDGGNMGIRRRQLHTMFKRSDYDPLSASGAT